MIQTKQPKTTNNWLNPTNRFTPLQNENPDPQETDSSKKAEPKPPPIYVSGVKLIEPLMKFLEENITKGLKEKDTEYHTYKVKQERGFRVFLRNLHPSTNTNEIKKELQSLGHSVTNIWNVKQAGTKTELPLFVVELQPSANNKDIYKIEKLTHSIVKFEPPRPKKTIPQCSRCQNHGHTKNFCNRTPRCVKCTGLHSTAQCEHKTRYSEVICVNCKGNHPASYKGCPTYQALHLKTFPPLRPKTFSTSGTYQPGFSFAQAAAKNAQYNANETTHLFTAGPPQQPNDITELKQMMKQLMEQMSTILNLLTTILKLLHANKNYKFKMIILKPKLRETSRNCEVQVKVTICPELSAIFPTLITPISLLGTPSHSLLTCQKSTFSFPYPFQKLFPSLVYSLMRLALIIIS
ncbi:hypothetical protein RI129_011443 [Pyrocoelia pectoralis]|uniref:Pre-C2HC domain-containing protein n=1 Tax=Pyrocoelia pectoralis TaxID=417401 RepID=A0AAN7V427_9COLE